MWGRRRRPRARPLRDLHPRWATPARFVPTRRVRGPNARNHMPRRCRAPNREAGAPTGPIAAWQSRFRIACAVAAALSNLEVAPEVVTTTIVGIVVTAAVVGLRGGPFALALGATAEVG